MISLHYKLSDVFSNQVFAISFPCGTQEYHYAILHSKNLTECEPSTNTSTTTFEQTAIINPAPKQINEKWFWKITRREEKRLLEEENFQLGFVYRRAKVPHGKPSVELPNGRFAYGKPGKWKIENVKGAKRYIAHDPVSKRRQKPRRSIRILRTETFLNINFPSKNI